MTPEEAKALRAKTRLTQVELRKLIGVALGTIQRYEQGAANIKPAYALALTYLVDRLEWKNYILMLDGTFRRLTKEDYKVLRIDTLGRYDADRVTFTKEASGEPTTLSLADYPPAVDPDGTVRWDLVPGYQSGDMPAPDGKGLIRPATLPDSGLPRGIGAELLAELEAKKAIK